MSNEHWLTTDEAMTATGLSKSSLYSRARRGQLPRPRRAPWNRRYTEWDAEAIRALARRLERMR